MHTFLFILLFTITCVSHAEAKTRAERPTSTREKTSESKQQEPAPVSQPVPTDSAQTSAKPPAALNIVTLPVPIPMNTLQAAASSDYALYAKSSFTNTRFDSLVEEGFRSYDATNLTQAIDFLQKAVAQGANSPFIHMKLAAAYEYLGNFYTATQYYRLAEKEIATLPDTHEYRVHFNEHVARALIKNNQFDEAMPYLEKAAQTSDEYWILSILADRYIKANNITAARDTLLRAVQAPSIQALDPKDIAGLYLTIGKLYINEGNILESERYLTYATQTDSDNKAAKDLLRVILNQKQQATQMEELEKIMQRQ